MPRSSTVTVSRRPLELLTTTGLSSATARARSAGETVISGREAGPALLAAPCARPPALCVPGCVADYERGHIPCAHFVDLDSELAGAPGAGRHPLPDAASFQAAMRRHGVSARTPVVVYDAADGLSAARAWWTLRYFGHPAVQ